eukprot:2251992-Alexandrium_andersonii.AAC.1
MSASLVGSEMCIRDRSMEVDPQPCNLRNTPHGSDLRDLTEKERRWVKEAVSYTHLTLPTICSV